LSKTDLRLAAADFTQRRTWETMLAEHFIQTSARRLRRPAPRLSDAALRQLMTRDWPGNIRELENVIERAIILARDGQLRFDPPSAAAGPRPPSTSATLPLLSRAALEKHQRDTIVAALDRSGGRVSGPGTRFPSLPPPRMIERGTGSDESDGATQ
jgi:DNA-binding NtrC family response regulator